MYQQCNTADGVTAWGHRSERANDRRFQQPNYVGMRRPKYNVPLNITENENEYVIELFATGFAKEDITMKVVEEVLYIMGSKKEVEEKRFRRQEFPIKTFERAIRLNEQVIIDKITGKSENGVLTIHLPKLPEAQKKGREIPVS